MELRHLRYFVAVAEALSFRRAAEGLHLAQPSLSRQIRDLEREIGERLSDRGHKQVALTAAGRALLTEARTLLAGAAAEDRLNDSPLGMFGTRTTRIGSLEEAFELLRLLVAQIAGIAHTGNLPPALECHNSFNSTAFNHASHRDSSDSICNKTYSQAIAGVDLALMKAFPLRLAESNHRSDGFHLERIATRFRASPKSRRCALLEHKFFSIRVALHQFQIT